MSASKGNFVGGNWTEATGARFSSFDPATGQLTWEGRGASEPDIAAAVAAAQGAFPEWAHRPLADRVDLLRTFEAAIRAGKPRLADVISQETGKPKWESATEVDAMVAKVGISIEAFESRCREQARTLPGGTGRTRYKPHGALAVLGPFNMPGHLPHGHIVPALVAGNTIVYKPSEQTPLVGEVYAELLAGSGFPAGVVNVVQGRRETGTWLVRHPGVSGVLFTGSSAGGLAIERETAGTGKLVALEMGGNNPLIFQDADDLHAAAAVIVQSAYITAGQRCTCARRLIVIDSPIASTMLDHLTGMIRGLRVGLPNDEPQPFMGTLISPSAADALLAAQESLEKSNGHVLVRMERSARSAALLTPGLVDVTDISDCADMEHFGPLLQLIRVPTFDAAIAEANRTAYGLSAGLISSSTQAYDRFARDVRAGVLAWNRPMTGASSLLPFGGIGRSGNHRPSGYFASDYASYAVAAVETPTLTAGPLPPGMAP
jgi:succinylglutamic semialdehyde dehydrogenase